LHCVGQLSLIGRVGIRQPSSKCLFSLGESLLASLLRFIGSSFSRVFCFADGRAPREVDFTAGRGDIVFRLRANNFGIGTRGISVGLRMLHRHVAISRLRPSHAPASAFSRSFSPLACAASDLNLSLSSLALAASTLSLSFSSFALTAAAFSISLSALALAASILSCSKCSLAVARSTLSFSFSSARLAPSALSLSLSS
jgi:hypothetical protein